MNQIVCRECNTPNPEGSKFCNNCGTRMPPRTSILCPSCQTPNPKSRFYCDNCGSRLVKAEIPVEKPKPEHPSEIERSRFSLPARKPGDTGELDPGDIPDWLRTGKTHPETSDSSSGLPRIEEIHPSSPTGDLPDWLVGDDAKVDLGAPEAITTEHYLELMNKRESDSPVPEDPVEEDAGADLPGWLTEFSSADQEDDVPDVAEGAVIPDWLPNLQQDTAVSPPSPPEPKNVLADWMSDIDDDDIDLDDFLSDAQPAAASAVELSAVADGPSVEEDDFPDWLSGADAPAEQTAVADDLTPDADIPDWLSEAAPQAAEQSEASDDLDDMSDWMDDMAGGGTELFEFDDDPAAKSETPLPTTAAADAGSEFLADDFDWMDDEPVGDAFSLDEFSDNDTLPEVDPLADEAADAPLDDWLSDIPDSAPLLNVSPEEHLSKEDLPNWLGDVSETAVDPFDVGEEETGTADDLNLNLDLDADSDSLDWLADLGDEQSGVFLDMEGTGMLDLPELHESAPPQDDFSRLQQLKESADDSMPDWLNADAPSTGDLDDLDEALTGLLGDEALSAPDDALDWLSVPEEKQPAADDLFGMEDQIENVTGGDLQEDDFWQEETVSEEGDLDDEPDWLIEYATGLLPDLDESTESPPSAAPISAQDIDLPSIDDDMEGFFAAADKPEADALFAGDDSLDFMTSGEPDDLFADMGGNDALADDLFAMDAPAAGVDDLFAEPVADDDLFGDFDDEPVAQDSAVAFAEEIIGGGDSDLGWIGGDDVVEDGELPDWLGDLGEATGMLPSLESESEELVSDAALPDWIADMRPEAGDTETGLADALTASSLDLGDYDDLGDLADAIAEDELGGDAGLPEWLQGAGETAVAAGIAAGTVSSDDDLMDEMLDDSGDWSSIDLSDLPPSVPLEDQLSKAAIPEWMEAFKPAELTDEEIEAPPAAEPEKSGPLAGISGVVEIQPALETSYAASAIGSFAVTKEHQQQAALLRQLTQGDRKLASDIVSADDRMTPQTRWILTAVVLLAVLIGLWGPTLAEPAAEPPPAVVGVHEAIAAAGDKPVLVAFEYTPAMAGELNAQAETLLSALEENGNPVLAVTQYAAGLAVADAALEGREAQQFGMITGEAAGLRQLASCIGENASCKTLLGRSLSDDEQAVLKETALIVLLTGERDSLVNWIEQVGAVTNTPIAAAVTTAQAPLAVPYYVNDQLAGMLEGLGGALVYDQQWGAGAEMSDLGRFNAGVLAQLTAAIALIIGGLIYGLKGKQKGRKGT